MSRPPVPKPRNATTEEWNEYIGLMERLAAHPCVTGVAGPANNEQVKQLLKNPNIGEESLRQLEHACWLQLQYTVEMPVAYLIERAISNILAVVAALPMEGRRMTIPEVLTMTAALIPAFLANGGRIPLDGNVILTHLVKSGFVDQAQVDIIRAEGISFNEKPTKEQLDRALAKLKELSRATKGGKPTPGSGGEVN